MPLQCFPSNLPLQVDRMAAELEGSRDLSRVIVHVDMDAFYAAVEMRDCPELKDKPMAVGSMSMLVGSTVIWDIDRIVTIIYKVIMHVLVVYVHQILYMTDRVD